MGYKYIINYSNYSDQPLSGTDELQVSFTAGGVAFNSFQLITNCGDPSVIPPVKSTLKNIYFKNNVNNATWSIDGWEWEDEHTVVEDLSIIEFDLDPIMHNQLDRLINENTLVAIPDVTYEYNLKTENLTFNRSGGDIYFISADYDNANLSRLYRRIQTATQGFTSWTISLEYSRVGYGTAQVYVYNHTTNTWSYPGMNHLIFLSDPKDATSAYPVYPDRLIDFLEDNKQLKDYVAKTSAGKILKTSSGKVLVIKK